MTARYCDVFGEAIGPKDMYYVCEKSLYKGWSDLGKPRELFITCFKCGETVGSAFPLAEINGKKEANDSQ